MSTTTDGETTLAVLDFKLEPGFWIYAPGSDAEFKFGVRAPSGFGYQVAGDPVLPKVDGRRAGYTATSGSRSRSKAQATWRRY